MEKYGLYFCSNLVKEVPCPLDIREIGQQHSKCGKTAYVTIIEGNSKVQVWRHLFRYFTDYYELDPTVTLDEWENWDGTIDYLVNRAS